jgi:hypothetical protein
MPISDEEFFNLLAKLRTADAETAKKIWHDLGFDSTYIKKRAEKKLKRRKRVLRLLAVVQAYHHYTMMQMSSNILQHDTNWKEAEQMSDFVNMLMPYRETSPSDFIHDKDVVTDEALDNYNGFKKCITAAKTVGISEKTVTAFCKNVDNYQSVFRLKGFGHIYYSEWLMALFAYINKAISKEELQIAFVEYSLSTGKPKPANVALFRKTIMEIEEVILQISNKQISRSLTK